MPLEERVSELLKQNFHLNRIACSDKAVSNSERRDLETLNANPQLENFPFAEITK